MSFDSVLQRKIMGRFATGITVVTTRCGDELHGMTANAVTSLSLDPPLVLVAIDRRAHMHQLLSESRVFALNLLDESQQELSQRFAKPGPKSFADLNYMVGQTGSPVFLAGLGFVDCEVHEILAGGDHDLFIGRIVAGEAREGRPLLYFSGKYSRLADG